MKKLTECVICEGEVWTEEHRYYSNYTDSLISNYLQIGEKPPDDRNKVFRIPIWEWQTKGFFSGSKQILIKNIS